MRDKPLFFCQIEAVETAIYITEVARKYGDAWIENDLRTANDTSNPGLPRMALRMATESGKTVVMAMVIAERPGLLRRRVRRGLRRAVLVHPMLRLDHQSQPGSDPDPSSGARRPDLLRDHVPRLLGYRYDVPSERLSATFTADFNEFIASLNAHSVEFLIVGAYALAFHGAPRFTGDLGLFIRPTPDNAAKVLDAVRAFGFPVETLQPVDLTDPRRILEMGIEAVQIHVMSAISGVSWDEAWRTRAAGVCGDQTVAFLGRDAFLEQARGGSAEGSGGHRRAGTRGFLSVTAVSETVNASMPAAFWALPTPGDGRIITRQGTSLS